MQPIYADVGDCRALIVDANATSRSVLAGMLRDMGVGQIVQTSRVADARRTIEAGVFDIILCDYHFEDSPTTGQDLLDDLRRAQLLPYSTVFVMVTGEASYARVAEAAEGALDGYLLKPHTAAALEQRLKQARRRKKVLANVFEAIERGDFARAAALAVKRYQDRREYWLFAARVGGELLLRVGRPEAARRLFDAVRHAKALPWSRLGVARADLDAGRHEQATAALEHLIDDEPGYADAYDVLGRAQVEQGELDAALQTCRSAVAITPHSIARLQKQGMLAFHLGEHAESLRALESATRIGLRSKMFDPQSLVLLALGHFDRRDRNALERTCELLRTVGERAPDDARAARFNGLSGVLQALAQKQPTQAIEQLRAQASQITTPAFDLEAAGNFLAVAVRLRACEVRCDEVEGWVRLLAERFCVSRATTELLRLAVRGDAPCEALVGDSHAAISAMAEAAMAHSVNGAPAEAVRALAASGAKTRNAKLIELAGLVLQRHAQKIGDSGELTATIDALRQRYCTRAALPAVGSGTGRAAGALSLRT